MHAFENMFKVCFTLESTLINYINNKKMRIFCKQSKSCST